VNAIPAIAADAASANPAMKVRRAREELICG
jgi:hypothetical protein